MPATLKWTLLLLLATPAYAENKEPAEIITQEMKVYLLKRAYHINNDSMVRWGAIDLSNEIDFNAKIIKPEKILPMGEKFENRFLVPPPEPRKKHHP